MVFEFFEYTRRNNFSNELSFRNISINFFYFIETNGWRIIQLIEKGRTEPSNHPYKLKNIVCLHG